MGYKHRGIAQKTLEKQYYVTIKHRGTAKVTLEKQCYRSQLPIYNYPHVIDNLSLIIIDTKNYISNMAYDNQWFILILSS